MVPAWPACPVIVTGNAAAAVDRGDDAERQVFLQQHRSLLDVHLEIAGEILAAARERRDRAGVEAGLRNGVGERNAVFVAPLQQRAIERARDRGAADIGCGKAEAFFLRERDQFDRDGEPPADPIEVLDHHEPGQDAQPPIVFAGIDHRVVVRAHHQSLGAGAAAG